MKGTEKPRLRWVALASLCALLWGNYFVYDLPALLSTHLQLHLHLGDTEYAYTISVLYTAYSLPNIVLPFIGGFIAEKYGIGRTLVWTLGLVICGHLLFVLGVQIRWVLLLVVGRIVLGLGGEIMGVAATTAVSAWFQNAELSLSLAIFQCVTGLSAVANVLIIPRVTEEYGPTMASWLSVSAFSLCICGIASILLIGTTPNTSKGLKTAPSNRGWTNEVDHCIGSLRRLPTVFWLTAINVMAIAGCAYPFKNSALRFLAAMYYGGDLTKAGSAMSIPDLLSVIFLLPFGLLLELARFKNYPSSILCASMMVTFAHILFLFVIGGSILPLCMLGISYALHGAAIYPSISQILSAPAHQTFSLQNASIPDDALFASARTSNGPRYSRLTDTDEYAEETHEMSAMELDSCEASIEELQAKTNTDTDLVIIGYGIGTSLVNLSLTVVPMVLAGSETWAGYFGIEMVFVGLAGIGAIAAIRMKSP